MFHHVRAFEPRFVAKVLLPVDDLPRGFRRQQVPPDRFPRDAVCDCKKRVSVSYGQANREAGFGEMHTYSSLFPAPADNPPKVTTGLCRA